MSELNTCNFYKTAGHDMAVRPGDRGRIGFSLLEVIISMAILSVVVLSIGSGFRLGARAWDQGEEETIATQRLRALSGLISQNIKSAYPYKMEIDGENVVIFKGDKNSVLFATTLADPAVGGFKWVKFVYRNQKFIFSEGILPDKDVMRRISKNEEIIDNDIEDVSFEYYSMDGETWDEAWSFGDVLPSAVRVKIAYFQPFMISIPMGMLQEDEDEIF
ncbi:MAG TPA: prepilin-type N-terminal cleavage/methylation domain-containing protein [Nitrospirae bacterium]|nr:prepilin-type N-terminal cleavage/methylation domain-containing protein [Nitrospirota bacterium]